MEVKYDGHSAGSENWQTSLYPVFKHHRPKIADTANSKDQDEVAHNEPLHQDLHCVSSILEFSI